jgi:hypothetical protein
MFYHFLIHAYEIANQSIKILALFHQLFSIMKTMITEGDGRLKYTKQELQKNSTAKKPHIPSIHNSETNPTPTTKQNKSNSLASF